MMGSFFQEYPIESGNYNLLTPGEVDEISKGLNQDHFNEPNSLSSTVNSIHPTSILSEQFTYQNEQCYEIHMMSGNWCLVNPRNTNNLNRTSGEVDIYDYYAPNSSHSIIVNDFPSTSQTENFVHRNDQSYEFQMVSGNWCLVNPKNANDIVRRFEEDIVCEYYLPNDETSSICEYPLDSGNWFLLTPSNRDSIISELEDVNSSQHDSLYKRQSSIESLRSIEICEIGNWYPVTSDEVDEINKCLIEQNIGEPNSLDLIGKNFKPSLGLLGRIAARHRKKSEFPWVDEDFDVKSNVAVWLYTRPIGGREDRETSRRHWAVGFIWHDRSATYEGMNIDGYNQPEWHEGLPTDVEETSLVRGWVKGYYLGKYFLSPKDVNVAAKMNKVNGYKYFAGHTNCHYWAKVFAESLGFTVPQISANAEPFAAMAVSLYKSAF